MIPLPIAGPPLEMTWYGQDSMIYCIETTGLTIEEDLMSLEIQVETILRVLLPDKWHNVVKGSFKIDAYEFVEGQDKQVVLRGGQSGVTATGVTWLEGPSPERRYSCPISAIIAVEIEVPEKVAKRR